MQAIDRLMLGCAVPSLALMMASEQVLTLSPTLSLSLSLSLSLGQGLRLRPTPKAYA